jgi:hypothetical protein
MIDINYHVITESGGAPPADYHASFTRLAELKVLDPWCPVCRCCHHLADVAGTESRRESPSRADRERRRKP